MRTLPTYAKTLILQGAAVTGTFTEGYFYIEEDVKTIHALELHRFCQWIDAQIGGASKYNIDMLFSAFKNPTNTVLQEEAQALAEKIKLFRPVPAAKA